MAATMRLPTLFILCFQAVLGVKTAEVGKLPLEVSGYLGESITLPSGANPSWSLIKIVWSIFTNNTWIATYQQREINTERFPQYTGRLTLNTTSGDLTIHNLKENDAIEYTVDLLNSEREFKGNKIKLTAKQKLQQPSIQIVTSTSVESGCLMVVNCSSLDKGVNLSWSVEPVSVLTINKSNPSDSSAQLFAFVSTRESFANFTCISRRNAENISSKAFASRCDRQISVSNCTTQPSPMTVTQPRDRNSLCFFGGIGASVLSALIYRYVAQRLREEKKKINQNEDPKKRESEEKERTEYKDEAGELVQEQGEPESPCSTVYA